MQEADPRWSCRRKKAYPTEKAADQVARKVEREHPGVALHSYGCVHCGLWHIGRRRRSEEAT